MVFEMYRSTKNGQWYWRLRTANNRIVADSAEGYHNKEDCRLGIMIVKAAHAAPVEEVPE